MASVNSNHGKREKDIKNNNTVCLNSVCLNTAEQSELYLRALKSEKREEIESLSQKYEKKIRKDIKERPLKEKLADINMNKISVIIEFFVGVWYSDNTAIVIVIAAFFWC